MTDILDLIRETVMGSRSSSDSAEVEARAWKVTLHTGQSARKEIVETGSCMRRYISRAILCLITPSIHHLNNMDCPG